MTEPPPGARHFPATARNRTFIRDVLERHLPIHGTVLEIGSGSGEHAVYFAGCFPSLVWQPSDPDPLNIASTRAWIASLPEGGANLREPLAINASDRVLPIDRADAVLCINVIHISPWDATEGLMRNAAALLPANGVLYLYGPFIVDGRPTAPSNEAFDRQLRSQNETWGIRNLADVIREAAANGLVLDETADMPANNLSVVFRKSATA